MAEELLTNSRVYYQQESVSEFLKKEEVIEQIVVEPQLEVDTWAQPPPKAQIVMANCGGKTSSHFWRDVLPRIADQDGIFKFGRIPISVVMPMMLVNKMTDPDAHRPYEDRSYRKWLKTG